MTNSALVWVIISQKQNMNLSSCVLGTCITLYQLSALLLALCKMSPDYWDFWIMNYLLPTASSWSKKLGKSCCVRNAFIKNIITVNGLNNQSRPSNTKAVVVKVVTQWSNNSNNTQRDNIKYPSNIPWEIQIKVLPQM